MRGRGHCSILQCSTSHVSFQVLQADGGVFCSSVNAATLALIDAGIPIKDYVCACSASLIEESAVVDINHMEESSARVDYSVATLPRSGQIVFMSMNGRIHEDQLERVMDTAIQGCKDVHEVLDDAVKSHVSDVAVSLGWNSNS